MTQEVEIAVTLLYHLGEGASDEALKPGTGHIAQLATGAAVVPHPIKSCIAHTYGFGSGLVSQDVLHLQLLIWR